MYHKWKHGQIPYEMQLVDVQPYFLDIGLQTTNAYVWLHNPQEGGTIVVYRWLTSRVNIE